MAIFSSDIVTSAISASIADTAVDVFVYDTSKDSDGGAWRKRTQNTSWYNETLGTATRGTRKEFPAVAVIVVGNDNVTIYDGDDPDLPMWMKFIQGANNPNRKMIGVNSAENLSSSTMINAKFVTGTRDGASGDGGLYVIDFIKDNRIFYKAGGYNGPYILNEIANRNLNRTSDGTQFGSVTVLVNSYVNDIAMTVLPNAPIDDATGLPIPTIAVATDGGLSVITDSGSVFDDATSAGIVAGVESCAFSGTKIVCCRGGASGNKVYVQDVSTISADFTSERMYRVSQFGETNEVQHVCHNLADIDEVEGSDDNLILGAEEGIAIINENLNSPTNGLVAKIASDYNTGWMHGNNKGTFLSDTTVESLTTNTNLATSAIANGTNRLSSETYENGDTSWSMVDASGTANGYVKIEFTNLVVGQTYVISMTWDGNATLDGGYTHKIQHQDGTASENFTEFLHWNKTNGSSETLTGIFTAQTTDNENLLIYANAITLNISNFIVSAVDDEDRSVNNKGLQVFGTVTKSAVATGADLVAYSGFSNNNNFRQPYNSDLNFEQNDFSIMFWVYDTGVNQHCTLISRDEREFDISRLSDSSGNKLRIYSRNSSEDLRAPDSTSALPQNKWVCVCVTYTGGNTKKVYMDGRLDRTITGTDGEYDIDNTSYGLNIGVRYTGGTKNYSADGIKLALMRISKSVPSAEQVKKMYEDEKVLFQENAKATLYGSSDAVTALAYDDTTNLLHVGTSDGRSDFQGLRRINNTTDPVTTEISAQDSLIIEQ